MIKILGLGPLENKVRLIGDNGLVNGDPAK